MELNDLIFYGDDAQERLKAGVKKLSQSVAVTMGPGGRYAIIGGKDGNPLVTTKDGVSVANSITLVDPIENMGSDLTKQTASKTVSDAGDGTTTSTVLVQAIIDAAPEKIINVTQYSRDMRKALEDVISELDKVKIKNPNKDQLFAAALTSSNGDEEIAEMVASTWLEVGVSGIVDVSISHNDKTTVDITKGYKLPMGYLSTAFINVKEEGVYERHGNINVLLIDGKLENFQLIIPILKQVKNDGGLLVVVAEDYSDDVQNNIYRNYTEFGGSIIPLKSAGFGDNRRFGLEDLGIYLNEGSVAVPSDFTREEVKLTLGTASYIKIGKDFTLFQREEGDDSAIQKRLAQCKSLKSTCHNPRDEERLDARIAQLSAGHAVIRVGGDTPAESKERFDRFEDTVGATRVAITEGILPGGGVALMQAGSNLTSEKAGYKAVLDATSAPNRQILTNADYYKKSLGYKTFDKGCGLNAMTGELINMVEGGIIDPYKVTVSALTNAVSVSSLILSTGVVIQDNFVQIN